MTEQTQTPEQLAEIERFNESVNAALTAHFDMNKSLIQDGHTPTAVALSCGLAAADLTASMAVEQGRDIAMMQGFIASLFDDMRKRADSAFEFYQQVKAELVAAAANDASVQP